TAHPRETPQRAAPASTARHRDRRHAGPQERPARCAGQREPQERRGWRGRPSPTRPPGTARTTPGTTEAARATPGTTGTTKTTKTPRATKKRTAYPRGTPQRAESAPTCTPGPSRPECLARDRGRRPARAVPRPATTRGGRPDRAGNPSRPHGSTVGS